MVKMEFFVTVSIAFDGFHARARCHTEETGFGIDGIYLRQARISSRRCRHNRFHLIQALWKSASQVRFAARRGRRR